MIEMKDIIISKSDLDYLRTDEHFELENILNLISNRKGKKSQTIFERMHGDD